jgi:hypothetical protein
LDNRRAKEDEVRFILSLAPQAIHEGTLGRAELTADRAIQFMDSL